VELPLPPRSSVLPPGAGNEPKKELEADQERAKEGKERELGVAAQGQLDAPTIRRHDDGDEATIPTAGQVHDDLRAGPPRD
jgi:hypothetical protein